MLKEIALPSIFSPAGKQAVRTTSLRQESGVRKALVIFLAVLNAALLLAYILGVNNYASTGYKIKALQSKISALSQENKKLTLEIAERASVANLEIELSQSGFLVVKNAKFLRGENQYSQK